MLKFLIQQKYLRINSMKDIKFIISLLLISGTVFIQAQNVVGYKREEILQFMKERHKEMVFETFTNNSSYK